MTYISTCDISVSCDAAGFHLNSTESFSDHTCLMYDAVLLSAPKHGSDLRVPVCLSAEHCCVLQNNFRCLPVDKIY